MEFQEYPKALYQRADIHRIVKDSAEEEAARDDGFVDHADLPAEPESTGEPAPPAKPARAPNKAK